MPRLEASDLKHMGVPDDPKLLQTLKVKGQKAEAQ